jgi:hypothetical protein
LVPVQQALAGAQEVAKRIGREVFAHAPRPDPSLEWRTTGRLRAEEIDPRVRQALCQRLASLVGDGRQPIRDPAVALLGSFGGPEHAAVLRSCLRHEAAATRAAAVYALTELGDRDSAAELLRLARDDEPVARRAAVAALARLGVAEARPLLVGMVGDPVVGAQAISALGQLGGEARLELEKLLSSEDGKTARLAAGALYGGRRSPRTVSAASRERLRRVRGDGACPLLHVSVIGAIRNLPAARPYEEPELTRLIGEVCGDYATTRRELVMDGLMVRAAGVYELTDSGRAVWRVERFLRDRFAGGTNA